MGWTRYAVALYLKGFPGAAAGPQFFLRTVEDLRWLLLTRPGEHFEYLFVHCLNRTLISMPCRLCRYPRARPLAGRFFDQNFAVAWLRISPLWSVERWNNRSATPESPLPQPL